MFESDCLGIRAAVFALNELDVVMLCTEAQESAIIALPLNSHSW